MSRPKSPQHELRREQILDLAAQCFAQHSYPAASMKDIASACGTSKARLYHYYESKEALLFDLLDRYTQRLLALIAQTEAQAEREQLHERAALHALLRAFLAEYEHSATRHIALLTAVPFLSDVPQLLAGHSTPIAPRELILNRQRDVVSAVSRFLRRAYPARIHRHNSTAITMMLFGMINWTFTWLRPGGSMGYTAFADEVFALLEQGLNCPQNA